MTIRELDIESVVVDGRVRVRVAGELDVATAPRLREALADARAAQPIVLLDLGGIAFMDSSGLEVLLDAASLSEASGGGLYVLPDWSAAVQRVLDVSGVGHLLPVAPAHRHRRQSA